MSIETFVSKVIFLLFNMLSKFVIAFLPRKKHLLLSLLGSLSAVILEPPPNKICHYFQFFPHLFAMKYRTGCHGLCVLNAEFQASFSMLYFHPHQEFFSCSSLSAIRVVSSAYLRLLIFLPAILISPSCIKPGISHDVLCI